MWFSPGSLVFGSLSSVWDSLKLLDLPQEVEDAPWTWHYVACPHCRQKTKDFAGSSVCENCSHRFAILSCVYCKCVNVKSIIGSSADAVAIHCRRCSRLTDAPTATRNAPDLLLSRMLAEIAGQIKWATDPITWANDPIDPDHWIASFLANREVQDETILWIQNLFTNRLSDHRTPVIQATLKAGLPAHVAIAFSLASLVSTPSHRRRLHSFAVRLGIAEPSSLESTKSADFEDACKLLDVSPSASRREVDRAYRRAANRIHPDRLLDSDDDGGRARSLELMKQYNAAYELVCGWLEKQGKSSPCGSGFWRDDEAIAEIRRRSDLAKNRRDAHCKQREHLPPDQRNREHAGPSGENPGKAHGDVGPLDARNGGSSPGEGDADFEQPKSKRQEHSVRRWLWLAFGYCPEPPDQRNREHRESVAQKAEPDQGGKGPLDARKKGDPPAKSGLDSDPRGESKREPENPTQQSSTKSDGQRGGSSSTDQCVPPSDGKFGHTTSHEGTSEGGKLDADDQRQVANDAAPERPSSEDGCGSSCVEEWPDWAGEDAGLAADDAGERSSPMSGLADEDCHHGFGKVRIRLVLAAITFTAFLCGVMTAGFAMLVIPGLAGITFLKNHDTSSMASQPISAIESAVDLRLALKSIALPYVRVQLRQKRLGRNALVRDPFDTLEQQCTVAPINAAVPGKLARISETGQVTQLHPNGASFTIDGRQYSIIATDASTARLLRGRGDEGPNSLTVDGVFLVGSRVRSDYVRTQSSDETTLVDVRSLFSREEMREEIGMSVAAREGDSLRRTFKDTSRRYSSDAYAVAIRGENVDLFRVNERSVKTVKLTRLAEEDRQWIKDKQGEIKAIGPYVLRVLRQRHASN